MPDRPNEAFDAPPTLGRNSERVPSCRRCFKRRGEWDHDLQAGVEGDGWHAVALTITGTAEFASAFVAEFGPPAE